MEGSGNCITEGEVDRRGDDLGHAGGVREAGEARSGAELSAEVERRVAAVLADPEAMAQLVAEQRSVDELHAAIGRQATRRTLELAGSPAERAWPPVRVREAWALSRYGADQIGPGSATAVRLSRDRHAQLLRAVRRYERYIGPARATSPGTPAERGRLEHLRELPVAGWAAFLHLASRGIHHSPAGSVQALDILSRQLRAIATANDPERRDAMARRATDRHQPAADWKWWKTSAPAWPAWMRLDADGRPFLEHRADACPGVTVEADHPQLPPVGDPHRRLIERDAWLVLGHWPPAEFDGRQLRHDRATGIAAPAARRPPLTPELAEQLELTRLEPGLTLEQARRLSPELRTGMLQAARTRAHHQHQADRKAFQQQLADTSVERGSRSQIGE